LPHLAVPTLTGYLRAHGVEVIQRDLNVEVMDRVLTRDCLMRAHARIRRLHGRTSRSHAGGPRPPAPLVQGALAQGPQLAEEVESAKAVLRGEGFYDGPAGRRAFEVVANSLQLVSLPCYPALLDLSSYTSGQPDENSQRLLSLVQSPQRNVFYSPIEGLVESLLATDPDVVGISIPSMGQFLAGLTVAFLLRKHSYTGHITVGGPHITMLREEIPHIRELFGLFDSAITFGGERPLLALVEALARGKPLDGVPNLIYSTGRDIRVTDWADPVPLSELPLPDFGGLDLSLYLVPDPVLPLITARGCYHGKCAFCNVGYGHPVGYEQLSAEKVVEQMLGLRERYGVRHIFFADEAITPRNLREMSRLLEGEGAPVHWATCARMERSLTGDLLAQMVRGGCRMLLYGLETGCERIAAAMHKGVTVAQMSRVLREGAEAGIWNHVFFFFGFPSETMAEAQETVDFLYAHGDHIHSAALGTFLLERYSPAHQHPRDYGIGEVVTPEGADLAIYFDYRVETGIDERLAETIVDRLMDALPTKPYPQFYVHDTYRFLYASRLHEQGRRFPAWLRPKEVIE